MVKNIYFGKSSIMYWDSIRRDDKGGTSVNNIFENSGFKKLTGLRSIKHE